MFKGENFNWVYRCEDWNAVYQLFMVAENIILRIILKVGAFINYLSLLPWLVAYTYQTFRVSRYNDSALGINFINIHNPII